VGVGNIAEFSDFHPGGKGFLAISSGERLKFKELVLGIKTR